VEAVEAGRLGLLGGPLDVEVEEADAGRKVVVLAVLAFEPSTSTRR
jgi:hypothetical protein